MNIDAVRLLLVAAKAAVNHLEACESGKIRHPFKSRSLPLLREALAEMEKAGGISGIDLHTARQLIVFVTRNMERESRFLQPSDPQPFMNDPYGLLKLIEKEARLTQDKIDAWMCEEQGIKPGAKPKQRPI